MLPCTQNTKYAILLSPQADTLILSKRYCTISLYDGHGRHCKRYSWTQTAKDAEIFFYVPKKVSAKDEGISVNLTPHSISFSLRDPGDNEALADTFQVDLAYKIYVGGSTWQIVDEGLTIAVLCQKVFPSGTKVCDTWWKRCSVDESPFDEEYPPGQYYEI